MATNDLNVWRLLATLQRMRQRHEGEDKHQKSLIIARRGRVARFYRQQRQQRVWFYLLLLTMFGSASLRCERAVWMKPRSSDWWERIVLTTFEDSDWRENFRMSHATFMYICNELRCRLQRQDTTMRQAITVDKRVAVALWKLATNNDYRSIGHLFGVSKATVCCIVQEVSQCIVDVLMSRYIKIPEGNHFKETITVFERKWGFPQCVGAIDGCHIPIIAPPEYHTDYFNHKGWHSVILQAVVGPCYTFWDINIGWPGSVHDAKVFANRDVYRKAQDGTLFPNWKRSVQNVDIPILVVGDPAYPLLPWLMKPFSDTGRLLREQNHFNYRLSRARNVVDNVYGHLKARWRCLLKRNNFDLQLVQVQVAACCTLNNICEMHGEVFHDEWLHFCQNQQLPQPITSTSQQQPSRQAERIRTALTDYFTTH